LRERLGKQDIADGYDPVIGKLFAIQHFLNPLHIYCRFLDRGLRRDLAVHLCKLYEILLFIWINVALKSTIYLCRAIEGDYTIQGGPRRGGVR
jgi:hypothetical protein